MATLLPGNTLYAGPITEVEYPKYRSLGHFITEKLKSFGDKVLLIDGITGRENRYEAAIATLATIVKNAIIDVAIDKIPKTPSGKILRRVVRDLLKQKLNSKL